MFLYLVAFCEVFYVISVLKKLMIKLTYYWYCVFRHCPICRCLGFPFLIDCASRYRTIAEAGNNQRLLRPERNVNSNTVKLNWNRRLDLKTSTQLQLSYDFRGIIQQVDCSYKIILFEPASGYKFQLVMCKKSTMNDLIKSARPKYFFF